MSDPHVFITSVFEDGDTSITGTTDKIQFGQDLLNATGYLETGDIVLIHAVVSFSTATIVPPSGVTLIYQRVDSAQSMNQAWLWYRYGVDTVTDFNLTLSGETTRYDRGTLCYVIRGCKTTGDPYDGGDLGNLGTGTTVYIPATTTTGAYRTSMFFGAVQNGFAVTDDDDATDYEVLNRRYGGAYTPSVPFTYHVYVAYRAGSAVNAADSYTIDTSRPSRGFVLNFINDGVERPRIQIHDALQISGKIRYSDFHPVADTLQFVMAVNQSYTAVCTPPSGWTALGAGRYQFTVYPQASCYVFWRRMDGTEEQETTEFSWDTGTSLYWVTYSIRRAYDTGDPWNGTATVLKVETASDIVDIPALTASGLTGLAVFGWLPIRPLVTDKTEPTDYTEARSQIYIQEVGDGAVDADSFELWSAKKQFQWVLAIVQQDPAPPLNGGYANKVIGVEGANIETVIGVDAANIEKVVGS